ncbi:MAG: N-acetylmuramoyl-L-alanine amidase [Nocardioidaceae bacterium]
MLRSAVVTAGLAAGVAAAVAIGVLNGVAHEPESTALPRPPKATTQVVAKGSASPDKPLAGKIVVIDPGHQLGNSRFPEKINRPVDAGGFTKPCNTTGTSTNAGFPEATFNWRVAKVVQRRLKKLGATVIMTRHRNSYARWGPCIDKRGKAGNGLADAKISIHGDGTSASAHGYHVIVSTQRHGFRKASVAFAKRVRATLDAAGFDRSTYVGGGTALSLRGDLGTLNLSRMPTVMVELGNMRNAGDARAMTSKAGQKRYAKALVAALRAQLKHD